ncbi:MAG: hypothetical protein ACJ75L_10505 [Gaiellaceae bacterium]
MSEELERRGNGSWPPFEPQNVAAMRHGFFADPTLRDETRAERAEIEAAIIEQLPYDGPFGLAVGQLAGRLWRQRRAYRDLDEHGLLRDGKPAPILDHLAKLENAIARDLEALGLTPRSASEMIERARQADPFSGLRSHLAARREAE